MIWTWKPDLGIIRGRMLWPTFQGRNRILAVMLTGIISWVKEKKEWGWIIKNIQNQAFMVVVWGIFGSIFFTASKTCGYKSHHCSSTLSRVFLTSAAGQKRWTPEEVENFTLGALWEVILQLPWSSKLECLIIPPALSMMRGAAQVVRLTLNGGVQKRLWGYLINGCFCQQMWVL